MRRRLLRVLSLVGAGALLVVASTALATCPQYGIGASSGTIPDASSMSLTFGVPRNGTITSLRVASLRATHPAVDDLEIHLISPLGTDVVIVDRVCPGSANLLLDLDDAAATPIPCPPTDGQAHAPSNPLSAFLGEPAAGMWTLRVFDRAAGNTGYFNEGHIQLCANCADAPLTVTFDAGSGAPHCFYEGALQVCGYVADLSPFPSLYDGPVQLGDNDGDASPDIANSAVPNGEQLYQFSLGGAPFAVTGFDFTYYGGSHGFSSSKSGSGFTVTSSGHVTPPAGMWSGITSFTWAAYDGGSSPGGVMDNLTIVAQCCGDGILDPGEQCEDGNFLDGDCCSGTCHFESSG